MQCEVMSKKEETKSPPFAKTAKGRPPETFSGVKPAPPAKVFSFVRRRQCFQMDKGICY
jgi:hypothetical protein